MDTNLVIIQQISWYLFVLAVKQPNATHCAPAFYLSQIFKSIFIVLDWTVISGQSPDIWISNTNIADIVKRD